VRVTCAGWVTPGARRDRRGRRRQTHHYPRASLLPRGAVRGRARRPAHRAAPAPRSSRCSAGSRRDRWSSSGAKGDAMFCFPFGPFPPSLPASLEDEQGCGMSCTTTGTASGAERLQRQAERRARHFRAARRAPGAPLRPRGRALGARRRGREAAPARGGGAPPGPPPRRRRGRLLRPPGQLPERHRLPRAHQPLHLALVPVVPLARVRLGNRPLLALHGRVRLARLEGALLRPGGRARARRERATMQTEKQASIDELSSSIAHEIRNPIAAAKSLVQQMGEDPTSVENVEYAKVAIEELDRVEHRVSHLLKLRQGGGPELRAGQPGDRGGLGADPAAAPSSTPPRSPCRATTSPGRPCRPTPTSCAACS